MVDNKHNTSRLIVIPVQYDVLPKYCKTCKLQGHAEVECRVIHPELKELIEKKQNTGNKHADEDEPGDDKQKLIRRGKFQDMRWNPTKRRFKRDTNTGEYLLEEEKNQPATNEIHLNNTFDTLQDQGEEGNKSEEEQTIGNTETPNIQENQKNNKAQFQHKS
ncbi:hypothetical protein KY284_001110 [Solanum tuberosum]|nr:hypothetical protein KY284_001110 [Solanum tuberosum]